ncbi:MAG: Nramp family divalent metal transporter [Bacteroidetes bacterium]|nr:Nramp family divalent metal transporter [Bacteroidota bacterium]
MNLTNPVNENNSDNYEGAVSVKKRGWFRRLFAFAGPAYLVSVGYMDPGNWATDIEGGSRFGYTLIWVLLMSNLMAVLLQTLSARLGIVTGYDLAQGCRKEYSKRLSVFLWLLAEIAIAACDLAEVLGTIIGLNLLFGLPLLWGCLITALDTFLLLAIQRLGVRKMEAFIVMLVSTIGLSFLVEIFFAQPNWHGVVSGFIPQLPNSALFVAIGIIGATVMPHNLYLHSSLVQTRNISNTHTGKSEACKFNLIDSAIALNGAFFVNAAILIVAAAVFYSRGIVITEIQQAHHLLEPILGTNIAPIVFGVALVAAGQSSTLTGTISGQIVMEGFLNIKLLPWLRRLITRGLALLPAVIVIALYGSEGTFKLLIFSQVVLSLQLPFAIIPLIHFTSDKKKMGNFANALWVKILAWLIAIIIIALNFKLLLDAVVEWSGSTTWTWFFIAPVFLAVGLVLGYLTFSPFFKEGKAWGTGISTTSKDVASRIQTKKYKNIGVALEHGEGDSIIISEALTLAKMYDAKLGLIHIVNTPGTLIHGSNEESLHSREDRVYIEELAREIEEYDLAVETTIRYGSPSEEIAKSVEEEGFDLLVLGSHGHQTFGDIIFGQTVDSVRHSIKIPIMVVRTGRSDREKPQRGSKSS